eukprot:m.72367 g.72367  ORF g.72367 m.72367 type:complete len:212 (+) comp12319_c1_seq1:177-812(+)
MDEELGVSQSTGASHHITTLQRAWVSEKSAPEILNYEKDAVKELLRLIDEQEELSREHAHDTVDTQFLFNVYQMEIGRLKYMVSSYLRTRLWKIEKYVLHITRDAAAKERLSEAELRYAKEYESILKEHMQSSGLDALPDKFQKIDSQTSSENMVVTPDLNSYVFIRVNESIGAVAINEAQDSIMLEKDDIYILRYVVVQPFLSDGRISVI